MNFRTRNRAAKWRTPPTNTVILLAPGYRSLTSSAELRAESPWSCAVLAGLAVVLSIVADRYVRGSSATL